LIFHFHFGLGYSLNDYTHIEKFLTKIRKFSKGIKRRYYFSLRLRAQRTLNTAYYEQNETTNWRPQGALITASEARLSTINYERSGTNNYHKAHYEYTRNTKTTSPIPTGRDSRLKTGERSEHYRLRA